MDNLIGIIEKLKKSTVKRIVKARINEFKRKKSDNKLFSEL